MARYLSNKLAIFLFIVPALLIFTLMVFYPILQTFYISFFDWQWLGDSLFIGFDNYARLFDDKLFYTSLYNGLIFAAALVVFQIGIGSLLAFSLSGSRIKGSRFLKTTYFIPVVLSVTVVCQLWLSIYAPMDGLINTFLEAIGVDYRQSWLSQPWVSIFAIAMVNAWQFMGYHFCLVFTAIKSVPTHYYEAAQIDGATKLQAHLHISIPLLAETYKFCLILAATGGLNAFAQMMIMTGGGPGTMNYSLTYMTYRSAFRLQEFGYGCASAAILVLECLLATVLINGLVGQEKITY
jgi:raffinose/stachyose/melibiose transport system permease protein